MSQDTELPQSPRKPGEELPVYLERLRKLQKEQQVSAQPANTPSEPKPHPTEETKRAYIKLAKAKTWEESSFRNPR